MKYSYDDGDLVRVSQKTAEEMTELKDRVGRVLTRYGIMVYVRFWKNSAETSDVYELFLSDELVPNPMTAVWDTYAFWKADVQHYMEDEGMTQQEAEQAAYNRADYDVEQEQFIDDVVAILKAADSYETGIWFVRGWNMGWRHLRGRKIVMLGDITPESAAQFLRDILPDTSEYTLRMELENPKAICPVINMSVSHHDAPTGEGREIVAGNAHCDECGSPGFRVETIDDEDLHLVEEENIILEYDDRNFCARCLEAEARSKRREVEKMEETLNKAYPPANVR